MSRHRSPSGGRHGTRTVPRAAPALQHLVAGAPTRRPQHGAEVAVHRGMSAAVAGGVVAALAPALVVGAQAADTGAATMRLAADETHDDGPGATAVLASIVPVTSDPEPPELLDVQDLIKASGLLDDPRIAQCDSEPRGLGRVKPWVREGATFLSCLYDDPELIGVAQRSRPSDHTSGHAVDLMTRGAKGDRIADCALANKDEMGVEYVIWKQRVNHGEGWERMEDRGSDTENHFDHVHVSFEHRSPDGDPVAQRCR
ncbi:hypothetical protein WEH80_38335 [Actinomycetes bacterium KLBMP 9759]